jgi:hypothetical protein
LDRFGDRDWNRYWNLDLVWPWDLHRNRNFDVIGLRNRHFDWDLHIIRLGDWDFDLYCHIVRNRNPYCSGNGDLLWLRDLDHNLIRARNLYSHGHWDLHCTWYRNLYHDVVRTRHFYLYSLHLLYRNRHIDGYRYTHLHWNRNGHRHSLNFLHRNRDSDFCLDRNVHWNCHRPWNRYWDSHLYIVRICNGVRYRHFDWSRYLHFNIVGNWHFDRLVHFLCDSLLDNLHGDIINPSIYFGINNFEPRIANCALLGNRNKVLTNKGLGYIAFRNQGGQISK